MGFMICPPRVSRPHEVVTNPNRREFLGSFLGALVFWRPRKRRKLTGIQFRRIRNGGAPRRYLLIHGNEQTARAVLTSHMANAKGTAWLVENPNRNVQFEDGELDPNRMFSRDGAERNLRALNAQWGESRVANGLLKLDRSRYQLLRAVWPEKGDVLIVVHNNVDYSVNDELAASNRTALNDKDNPHEFCLCTSERDFELLSKGPYNAVLQNRPSGADDGSLSRFAAREGFRYVNIECGLGKYEKQLAFLSWVDQTLPRA